MIIRGKYLISNRDRINNSHNAVYIKKDKIEAIGSFEKLKSKYPEEEVIGDEKHLIMPGLIDAHTHGAGLSFIQRGVKYDYLENFLLDILCAFDLEPEMNSMLNAVRHIKNGCTTIHHNNWTMPLDTTEIDNNEKIIDGYKKTGARIGFSIGTRIQNILAYDDFGFYKTLPSDLRKQVSHLITIDKEAAINHYFNVFEHLYKKYNGSTIKIFFGPSWVQGSTDVFLQKIKKRADELGKLPIHIHTLQTALQKAYGIRTYNKSLVEYLNDIDVVDNNLVLGHAVFVNKRDIEILAEKNASVTHHPSCNLIMRNGIAPIYFMLQAGVNVALGIDEKGINDDEDPIMEMRLIYFLHRASGFNLTDTPSITAADVIKIGTENGSYVTGYSDDIGVIEQGKKADIILVNLEEILHKPWSSSNLDIKDIFIHRALGRHVTTMLVNGNVIMKERKIQTIDVEQLYKEAYEQAQYKELHNKTENKILVERIKPYYQKWYNNWVNDLELDPFYIMNSKL